MVYFISRSGHCLAACQDLFFVFAIVGLNSALILSYRLFPLNIMLFFLQSKVVSSQIYINYKGEGSWDPLQMSGFFSISISISFCFSFSPCSYLLFSTLLCDMQLLWSLWTQNSLCSQHGIHLDPTQVAFPSAGGQIFSLRTVNQVIIGLT